MSQPPWENQPPQGWGSPPPQQPGWNQGPHQGPPSEGYPQPHPAQRPQYENGPDGYGRPTFDPFATHQGPVRRDNWDGRVEWDGPEQHDDVPYPPEPVRRKGGNRVAGIAGVCVLLVIGVTAGAVVLTRGHGSADNSVAPPPPTVSFLPSASGATSSGDAFPSTSSPGTSDSSAGPSSPDPGQSSAILPGVDPATLDSAATDTTPFTASALFAKNFVDSKSVAYTLKAAAVKSCAKVGDSVVTPIVQSARCTQFMAASWIDASRRVVVSAMVIPYPDAATAKKIEDKLGKAARTGDYNQWCPPAGQPGAQVCAKLTPSATREGMAGAYHRYMLITTAVYVDLRNDAGQASWLSSAANGAFQSILPGT